MAMLGMEFMEFFFLRSHSWMIGLPAATEPDCGGVVSDTQAKAPSSPTSRTGPAWQSRYWPTGAKGLRGGLAARTGDQMDYGLTRVSGARVACCTTRSRREKRVSPCCWRAYGNQVTNENRPRPVQGHPSRQSHQHQTALTASTAPSAQLRADDGQN